MLILCLLICHTILKRECMCETMNPGPFLIIRNTFPTTFKHLLHSAILKSENTKHFYSLHSHIKTPKIPSIIITIIFAYLFTTIAFFIYCFASFIILISFSHLVLDNHLVRLRAQTNLFVCRKSREGQEDKTHTTDSLRVRY